MTKDPIIEAVQSLRPGARWEMVDSNYANINWLDKAQTKPTLAEVNAEISRMQALPPDTLETWDAIALKIAFNHENRIRVLEGKAAVTLAQFKTALRALL